jgi:hypothetical protein
MRLLTRLLAHLIISACFIAVVIAPVFANEDCKGDKIKLEEDYDCFCKEKNSPHGKKCLGPRGHDQKHSCPSPIPESLTSVQDLIIDNSLIEATPHWFLLAAGKDEQTALLDFIERSDIPREKKSTWEHFLTKIWMKYPIQYEKTDTASKLIPPKGQLSLTLNENVTFQEIERYISDTMQKSLVISSEEQKDMIFPQWAQPDHSDFSRIACEKEKIPNDLEIIMFNSADDPDSWYDYFGGGFIHSRDHGFVPTPPFPNGIGGAPYRCGEYAWLATNNFQSHRYETAFTNLGYSSHFMEDLGNPYHTPQVQIILLQFIDDPDYYKYFEIGTEVINYKALHDSYEAFLNKYWTETLPVPTDPRGKTFSEIAGSVTDYVIITDPVQSAKMLAEESWNINPNLFWNCYWRYIKTGQYDFENDPVIVQKTIDRVIQTEKYTRGLIHYVTGGKPLMISINSACGPGGKVTPLGTVSVQYGTSQYYSIAANPGYLIDGVSVDGTYIGGSGEKTFTTVVQATLTDHAITVFFKPEPVINVNHRLFEGFNTVARGQVLHPYSGTLDWNGVGRVYLTGGNGLVNTWADDAFDITTDSGFRTFTGSGYYEGIPDITQLLRPGSNHITIDVRDIHGWSIGYHETWVYYTGSNPVMMITDEGTSLSHEEQVISILNETEPAPVPQTSPGV